MNCSKTDTRMAMIRKSMDPIYISCFFQGIFLNTEILKNGVLLFVEKTG